jgi:hypothetical protein
VATLSATGTSLPLLARRRLWSNYCCVAGGWWLLVAGGWWLVAGGWWLVAVDLHFVRCIKPNGAKQRDLFEPFEVLRQLRCATPTPLP